MSLNTVMKPHRKNSEVMIANGPRKAWPLVCAGFVAAWAVVLMLAIGSFDLDFIGPFLNDASGSPDQIRAALFRGQSFLAFTGGSNQERQGGRGAAFGRNRPFVIGSGCHLKHEFATFENFVVAQERPVELFAIQRRALDIRLLRAVIGCADDKRFAVPQLERRLVKQRTADDVIHVAGANRVEAERAENIPR